MSARGPGADFILMKFFLKRILFYIPLLLFLLSGCSRDPYIRELPSPPIESAVQLDFRFDNSLKPEYREMSADLFCVGRTEFDLETNCETQPILRDVPVSPQGSLLLKLSEGRYPFAKVVLTARGGSRPVAVTVFFSDDYAMKSKSNCEVKGMHLEGSLSRLRYNCKGLSFRAKEKHTLRLRILDESITDGLLFYTMLLKLPMGSELQAADVSYTITK